MVFIVRTQAKKKENKIISLDTVLFEIGYTVFFM